MSNLFSKKAIDIMKKDIIVSTPDENLKIAAQKLLDNRISGLPVVNNDFELIGIITEKDIIEFTISGNLLNTPVKEAMKSNVVSCKVTEPIEKVALTIVHNNFRRVPITENDKLVGIISRRDVLRYLVSFYESN